LVLNQGLPATSSSPRGAGIDARQIDIEGRFGGRRLGRVEAQLAGKALEFAVDRDTHLLVGEVDGALVGLHLVEFDGLGGEGQGEGEGDGEAFHGHFSVA
jgi:hypothetical protein